MRSEFTAFQAAALIHAANYESEGAQFLGVPSSNEARYNGSSQPFTVIYKRDGRIELQDAKANILRATYSESAPKKGGTAKAAATAAASSTSSNSTTTQTKETMNTTTTTTTNSTTTSPATGSNGTLEALANVVANLSASEYERGRKDAEAEINSLNARLHELEEANAKLEERASEGSGTIINVTVNGDTKTTKTEKIVHPVFARVLRYLANKENVYLYGPAGAGKNVICEQVAEALGVPFYYQNTILSKHDLSGYIEPHNGELLETPFYLAAKDGGVFMLDEVDNCTAEAMIALNAALANGYFTFPKVGRVKLHEKFVCVAAGNTAGLGATADFCGRYKLDESSRDRFTFVEVGYCPEIENALADGDDDILEFVRDLRHASMTSGIYVTAGYRLIKRLHTFGDGDKKDCINDFVFRGLDVDSQARLVEYLTSDNNPYNKAAREAAKENSTK